MKMVVSWATRDAGIKVVAVLVAIVLWFQASEDRNPIVTVSLTAIPVSIVDVPGDMMVLDSFPRTVTVTVRGGREQLDRLPRSELVAQISGQAVVPGQMARLDVLVEVPSGLQVVEVQPAQVQVIVDQVVRRQIPVDVEIEGQPGSGFRIGHVSFKPTDILVEGPRSVVQTVVRARAMFDATGASDNILRTLPIVLFNEDDKVVSGASYIPQMVDVTVEIERIPARRRIGVEVDVTGEPAAGYVVTGVEVDPGEIEVQGSAEAIGGLRVVFSVDVSGATDTVLVRKAVSVPDGAVILGRSSCDVRVVIERERMEIIDNVTVLATGLAPGLKAVLDPGVVRVELTGADSIVTGLMVDDVMVEVDCIGLEPGEHEVELMLQLPPGVNGKVVPASVTVMIVDGRDADG